MFRKLSSMLLRNIRTFSNGGRVQIDVCQGTVSGVRERLPNGEEFYAFRGIPYAKPPVGKLRFRAPEPLDRFTQPVLDCSTERDICYSKDMFTRTWSGSEDCLHLNVYTPDLRQVDKPLPVMVFIHGGGYGYGSGNSDCHSPEPLLEEDVIVVTMNYRLGSLGFLHLPSQGIEGNAGLKDQLMALKWVRQNIHQFKGDPQNVTLFGSSAGASATHLHLLSPESQKYFDRAICQGCVSLQDWAVAYDGTERTRSLAKLLNAAATTDEHVLETLLNADLRQLMSCAAQTIVPDGRPKLPIAFRPVVEQNGTENAVVPLHPAEAMKIPNRYRMPVMVGMSNNDSTVVMPENSKKLHLFDDGTLQVWPESLSLPAGSKERNDLAGTIRRFYFGDQRITKSTLGQLADLLSDHHFGAQINRCAELHARYQHRSPLFFYQFAFDGALNIYTKLNQQTISGAGHADDTAYLFRMRMFPCEVHPDSAEARVRRYMCRMWANFAKYGHPTPESDHMLPFRWNPVASIGPDAPEEQFKLQCLVIDEQPAMIEDPNKRRIDFWRSIYSQWKAW